MKNVIRAVLLISSIFFLIACVDITQSEPITINSKIVYKHHEDSKSDYTYHYGYNFFNGKYQYHWGSEDIAEKNTIKFVVLNDTLTRDSKELFDRDSLIVTYVKVYYDGKFKKNKIKSVN